MYNWFQWRTVLLIIESILHNSISFYPPKYIRSNGTQSNGPYMYITYVLLIILFKMRENMIWVRFYSQQTPIVRCWWGGGGEIPNYTKEYYRLLNTNVLWRVKVKGWVGGVVVMGVVENELHRKLDAFWWHKRPRQIIGSVVGSLSCRPLSCRSVFWVPMFAPPPHHTVLTPVHASTRLRAKKSAGKLWE